LYLIFGIYQFSILFKVMSLIQHPSLIKTQNPILNLK
jgi:hypothetical protein